VSALTPGPADFVVLAFESSDGERFAIFRQGDWFRSPARSRWASHDKWLPAITRFMPSLELFTEEAIRARLREMGLDRDSATRHIVRARRIRDMNKIGALWEAVSEIGYRNEEGQVVMARTTRTGGVPRQRVFVMRCSVCGYQYGTYGSEIPHRCCPNCQDGPPGLRV
jgi:hypothetical protein